MERKRKKLALTLLAGTVAAAAVISHKASAELVLESDLNQPAYQADTARGAERENFRQVLNTSRKAEITMQQQPIYIQQPVQQHQYMAQTQQPGDEVNMSRSELMRRSRVREELKNEDILQEKLENLRLQDEARRTAEVSALAAHADLNPQAQPVNNTRPVVTGNEVVVAPVSDHPGKAADVVIVQQSAPAGGSSTAQITTTPPSNGMEPNTLKFSPRLGMAGTLGSNAANINSRYAAGLGAEVGVSDSVGVEMGYTYGEYGAKSSTPSPIVQQYQFFQGGSQLNEPLTAKQNIFDAGVKLYFLGSESRIRPFVGGGAAYSRTFVNYDQVIIDRMGKSGMGNLSDDYQLDAFMGQISTGLDLRISKNVSIGAVAKFYNTLSSRSNQPNTTATTGAGMYNPYLTNPYNPYASGYNAYYPTNYGYNANGLDQDRRDLANSFLNNNFYVVQMGVSFGF